MNTPGTNKSPIIIGDADGLIALLHTDDVNHAVAVQAAQNLVVQKVDVLFPLTAIVEAATALQRQLNNAALAETVRQQVINGELLIEEVEKDILTQASDLFHPFGSKQNTLFDAIVATIARKYSATGVFSFDDWYTKQGFILIPHL
jgi:predicted nucleic acid-binding protein